MKFKVFKNQEERWAIKQANGTCLKNQVDCSYDELIDLFGEPTSEESSDGKVQVEWVVLYDDGRVCTIYDWKEYDTEVRNVRDWHLGGNDGIAPKRVKKLIIDNKANSLVT